MGGQGAKSLMALGFLSVIDAPPHGLFGGYLILNTLGRPLEFHCTAPVKANRAQKILYGPTLKPYLYAEQIGQTLLAKAHRRPPVVLTDSPHVLELRNYIDTPVALVVIDSSATAAQAVPDASRPAGSDPEPTAGPSQTRVDDGPNGATPALARVQLAQQQIAVAVERDGDLARHQAALADLAERLDLAEPFQRIRAAIYEAQKINRDG